VRSYKADKEKCYKSFKYLKDTLRPGNYKRNNKQMNLYTVEYKYRKDYNDFTSLERDKLQTLPRNPTHIVSENYAHAFHEAKEYENDLYELVDVALWDSGVNIIQIK
jgi:hypothetical protein